MVRRAFLARFVALSCLPDAFSHVLVGCAVAARVGDCLLYTNAQGRLQYYVGGEVITLGHLDRCVHAHAWVHGRQALTAATHPPTHPPTYPSVRPFLPPMYHPHISFYWPALHGWLFCGPGRRMYMLGYLAKEGRVFLMDKTAQIASYQIPLSILEYQTAVVRR